MGFNPNVIADGETYVGQMGAAIKWALSDQEPTAIYKNRKVPISQLNRTKKVAISGSEVINRATGSRIRCFEYSSKAVSNLMRAL